MLKLLINRFYKPPHIKPETKLWLKPHSLTRTAFMNGDLSTVMSPRTVLNWAENGGPWPRIASDHPAYFYTLRAADTPDRDLVNRMLAELTSLDIRQLFICNKPVFYRRYMTWSDTKKDYVADFLSREYQVDKAGARAALFGHEPDMTGATPTNPTADLIRKVGPWGAVGRV